MLKKIKNIFGDNFLLGEIKNVNILYILKQCRLKIYYIHANLKFITAIIFYFQEFLDIKLDIKEIKEKYSLFFKNSVILDELINKEANTRRNYEINLKLALDNFFDLNETMETNQEFLIKILSYAADIFQIHICIITRFNTVSTRCHLEIPDENNFNEKIIVIYKEDRNFNLLINIDYKIKYEFDNNEGFKKLNNGSIENDYYKAAIFSLDVVV